MKIKLSKSQWDQIGKLAGWTKKSHHNGEYSKETLDMTLSKFLDELEERNPSLYESIEKYLDKKTEKVKTSSDITPSIKRYRTIEYDVCPHCNEEIMEKSTFGKQDGDTWYIYHSGKCATKSPIRKLTKEDSEKALKEAFPNLIK